MRTRLLLFLAFAINAPAIGQKPDARAGRLEKKAMRKSDFIPAFFVDWKHVSDVKIDSIHVDRKAFFLDFYFNPPTTHIPARKEWISDLRTELHEELGRSFRDYEIRLWARGHRLEDLIPNALRDSSALYDTRRLKKPFPGPALVRNLNQPIFEKGLSGNHIALWPSHGYFFDQQLDRWQWQRARLWQTVEDIFPWSFTSAYLVPMLENAGANVLLPRERDTQVREVIVDNNAVTGSSRLQKSNTTWDSLTYRGFQQSDTLFTGQNPFLSGTSLSCRLQPGDTAALTYVPDIPETGDYAVYVSYAKTMQCVSNVKYDIVYSGGRAAFRVNQCMGGGTWIYLGTFHFKKGLNASSGAVMVSSTDPSGILSSDALRFGGGMGNVARKPGQEVIARQKSVNDGLPAEQQIPDHSTKYVWKTSGKPRWMEGSRYYLQYAGMPDSLTYNLNAGKNDYNDDYMSRPEWVNFLIGTSAPQYSTKYDQGLGIPVDMALAFHTDAGVTGSDSIVGTLGIYSTVRNEGIFPDGRSKLAGRDLTDLVQSQVVEDIRRQINPEWTRRGMWDREYSEAWRPVVPAMLLELLSHQNLGDMKYGLDPRFKFAASRAVYKGILRYLGTEQGREMVVQPLPPDHMAIERLGDKKIRVSWKAVEDPLEPSAKPDGFKLYLKKGDEGFTAGIYTTDNFKVIELDQWDTIYSFRVTALNAGGESLPGETLSVSLQPGKSKTVLVVNAFDRICAPGFFDTGHMAGIAWWEDEGVPYLSDLSFTGYQYNFNRNSEWIHDDNQGWGASDANMEMKAVAGNTFSFPRIHGAALRDAGYSFVSVSDEVFESTGFSTNAYAAVDIIFGEERGTPSFRGLPGKDFRIYTPNMIRSLTRYLKSGGKVFISGAYIGTDMEENSDSSAIHFASEVLHYIWRSGHATRQGSVYATDQGSHIFPEKLEFSTNPASAIYRVESPDAIEPVGRGAFRICRYGSGNTSAGVAFEGDYRVVMLGFPFETITDENMRSELMTRIMKFLDTP